MDERAHHLEWLGEFAELLQDPAQLTDQNRAEIIATCRQILSQNPTSRAAQDALRKVKGTVQPTTTEIKQHEPLAPQELQSLKLLETKILLSLSELSAALLANDVSTRHADFYFAQSNITEVSKNIGNCCR